MALGGCPPRAPTDPDVPTLEHPVPQVTLLFHHDLASAVTNPCCTIHRLCGDTSRRFEALQALPDDGRVTRCLASHPPGPRGSSSPDSSVLSRHCDFLPPFPPRFVSFAWRYHGTTHVSLPPPLRAAASGLGLFARYPPPGCFRGDDRISQVPGEPRFPFAHVLRPRPASACLTTRGTLSMAPALRNTKAPTRRIVSEFNSMAFGLAVYASQGRLPFPAQDSLPGAGQALLDGTVRIFVSRAVARPSWPCFLMGWKPMPRNSVQSPFAPGDIISYAQ